jgi:hypothetical protein
VKAPASEAVELKWIEEPEPGISGTMFPAKGFPQETEIQRIAYSKGVSHERSKVT